MPESSAPRAAPAEARPGRRRGRGPMAEDAASAELPVVKEGWLRKRGRRAPSWRERYFVLRGAHIEYYMRRGDMDPRGSYELTAGCTVSSVKHVPRSGRHDLYEIVVRWPKEEGSAGAEEEAAPAEEKGADPPPPPSGEQERWTPVRPRAAPLPASTTSVRRRDQQPSTSSAVNPRIAEIASHRLEAEKRQKQRARQGAEAAAEEDGGAKRRRYPTVSTAAKVATVAAGGAIIGAFTAGIGLAVTGLVVVGVSAASGGGAAIYAARRPHHDEGLVLAAESQQEAESWRSALLSQIQWSDGFRRGSSGSAANLIGLGFHALGRGAPPPPPAVKLARVGNWTSRTEWRVSGASKGVRILVDDAAPSGVAARKAAVCVRASPLAAFMAVMGAPAAMLRGVVRSVRIVETIDDHADVIHMVLSPLYFWPTWTSPRDVCVMRYWRVDDLGNYIVCYDSVEHRECPPDRSGAENACVRAELHAMYTIAPPRAEEEQKVAGEDAAAAQEALVTHVVQADPKGWIWSGLGYQQAFAEALLLHLLDLRDAVEETRFAVVDGAEGEEDVAPRESSSGAAQHDRGLSRRLSLDSLALTDVYEGGEEGDGSPSDAERQRRRTPHGLELAPPCFNPRQWSEPSADGFRVRGAEYLSDRLKVAAGEAEMRLLAVDVLEWSSPVRQNVLAHPQNRVALAYERATGKSFPDPMQNRPFLYDAEEEREPHACFQPEDCPEGVPWVFALHIMIPGPPHLGFVAYYTPVDPEWHKRDSPFARVARPFFFGGDPEYCDNHFKLIPKIVEGNFVVRRVVGSTPAVLGTKLKQYYHAAPHYFELDVDIGSSSVAAGVVRVSLGYAAAMTVDMAFVLEGKREQELPETVMGCVRCRGMELEKATFVE